MHSRIDLSTKEKHQLSQKEFYGLPAEIYGPQRFLELGIKNNSFKYFMEQKLRSHVKKIFIALKATEAHRILTFMEIKKQRVNATRVLKCNFFSLTGSGDS